jgi:N-methylhydantoinase A/oxoprolinase/acetone carboxylase beta subunit
LGGAEATFTDACVALGYLNPARFLGGARQLDVARAREVIAEKVAGPLRVGTEAAAVQIVHVAAEMVADSMRDLLKGRGQKPEDFTLFAFGGNGAILAAGAAERVGLRQAHVFDLGSVFSAFGSSVSDIVHTYAHAVHAPLNSADLAARLNEVVNYMVGEARRDMLGEGLDASQVAYALELEVSKRGEPSKTVRVPFTHISGKAEVNQIAQLAGQPAAQLVVEVARVKATFPMPRLALPDFPSQGADPSSAARGRRPVVWDGKATDTPIYEWDALQAGNAVKGPAVVEGQTTTYLVPANWTLTIDNHRNGLLNRKG